MQQKYTKLVRHLATTEGSDLEQHARDWEKIVEDANTIIQKDSKEKANAPIPNKNIYIGKLREQEGQIAELSKKLEEKELEQEKTAQSIASAIKECTETPTQTSEHDQFNDFSISVFDESGFSSSNSGVNVKMSVMNEKHIRIDVVGNEAEKIAQVEPYVKGFQHFLV